MKLTRQNVLDAIEHEPLKSGAWIETNSDVDQKNNCSVCAVGGTLRRAGMVNSSIENFGYKLQQKGKVSLSSNFYDGDDVEDQTEEALEQGHYLRALSIQFEYMSDVYKLEKVREKLKQWVLENIPETFESEIEWEIK